jgi:hypothetical protein
MVVDDPISYGFFRRRSKKVFGLLAMFTYIVKKHVGVMLNKCIFISSTVLSNCNWNCEFKEISTILGDNIPQ